MIAKDKSMYLTLNIILILKGYCNMVLRGNHKVSQNKCLYLPIIIMSCCLQCLMYNTKYNLMTYSSLHVTEVLKVTTTVCATRPARHTSKALSKV